MTAIALDFVARPPRVSRTGLILLVAGVVFATVAAYDDSVAGAELEQVAYRAKRAETAVKRAEQTLAAADDPVVRNRNALAAGLSGEMASRILSPWGALFDAVEKAHSEEIALIRLEPDAERGRLRLAGEAKNMGALVKYVAALEGAGGISDVRLISQQIKQEDAQHPVEFVVEANWSARGTAAPMTAKAGA